MSCSSSCCGGMLAAHCKHGAARVPRHHTTMRVFARVAPDPAVKNMRDARIAALTNTPTNKQELARAVETCVGNFLSLASSKQHMSKLNAMDAIGLIKLCRKGAQPSHIAQIWPHIKQLSMLPAKDDNTNTTLIGSVISCALEAKDSTTAASVWEFLCSFPHIPFAESAITRLLSALHSRPELIVEIITSLQRGTHCGVRANAQHFAVAIQTLSDFPDQCKQVFDMALDLKMVDAVTLVVWCQTLQQHKDFNGALHTLAIADSLSITPEPAHYTVLLSCAAELGDLCATKHIHKHLEDHHASAMGASIVVGALVKSYSQCGDFESAAGVFDHALKHKLVSAVTLVVWCQVLQQHKDLDSALNTLSIADSLSITPTPSHYTVLLSHAAEMKNLDATKRIHNHLNSQPSATRDGILFGSLMQSYSQCGDFDSAAGVFNHAVKHKLVDAVTLAMWCQALQQHKDFNGALDTLAIADSLSITPNSSHYTVLLSCAAELGDVAAIKRIHNHLNNHPTSKSIGIVLGALLQSYSQCGDFESAAGVFGHALKHKLVDAVTLVVWCQALQQHKDFNGALQTLAIADSLSITPTPSHYTVLLSCAGELGDVAATKHIHQHLNNHPTASHDRVVVGALIQSYSQCGDFQTCSSVFQHAIKHKLVDAVTLVVWCQALQQHKDLQGALDTLSIADSLGITPDPAHYTILLSCATEMNNLTATRHIHTHLSSDISANSHIGIHGVLIDSYARCGDLNTAVGVFEDGLQRGLLFDAKGWTSVVDAYAGHGMVKEAQATLDRMVTAGVKPDVITLTCLLNGASHAGLGMGVKELCHQLESQFPDLVFDDMLRTCVVDGLARAGLFDDAVAEARKLQYDVAWTAVLGAARSHNRLDIGELAFNELKRLSTDDATLASAHVLMSHMYTANGRHDEANKMQQSRKDKKLHKLPGESSIEVGGVVHTFRVNDTSHPEMKQIVELNDKLHEQLKADGYVPDVVWASRGAEVSNQSKEQALCEHSERFALVYGLLHSDEGQPLTIFKNLRVCGDCHNATKHASKVLGRKLTVKDMNRWHVFENGKCSCGDFW